MNETVQFGLTMLAAGMGGTMLTLIGLAALIGGLNKLLPPPPPGREDGEDKK